MLLLLYEEMPLPRELLQELTTIHNRGMIFLIGLKNEIIEIQYIKVC